MFVQRDGPVSWDLQPPLGFQGSEEHLALALASLPQPGLPPSLSRDGGCRRCVVVGSGGVLHGSHLGTHIDQYDIIIRFVEQIENTFIERRVPAWICTSDLRMNNAPVAGFERDAGSHTTVRLMYPEGAPHSTNEYKETAMVVLVVFKSLDLDWLTSVVTKQPLVRQSHRGQQESPSAITPSLSLSGLLVETVVLEGGGGRYSPETGELQDPAPGDYSQDGTGSEEIHPDAGKGELETVPFRL